MDETPDNHIPKQLIPYLWKKGVSANPAGRPKGKTLKEFAKDYLMSLPDEEKVDYLASLPTDIVWKMAEGNPTTQTDITTKGESILATKDPTDPTIMEALKAIQDKLENED